MAADEVIEIIKKRDEYPLAIEITDDNKDGVNRLTIKIRQELPDGFGKTALEEKINMAVDVYKTNKAKL